MFLSQITELGCNQVFQPWWYLFSLQWWAQGHKDAPMDNCSEKRCSGGWFNSMGYFFICCSYILEKTEFLWLSSNPAQRVKPLGLFFQSNQQHIKAQEAVKGEIRYAGASLCSLELLLNSNKHLYDVNISFRKFLVPFWDLSEQRLKDLVLCAEEDKRTNINILIIWKTTFSLIFTTVRDVFEILHMSRLLIFSTSLLCLPLSS